LLRGQVFLTSHEPVVALGERAARAVALVEVVVGLEQPPILFLLVGPADLLTDEPAHPAQEPWLAQVEGDALPQKLDALHHPGVAVVVVVELDGDVVGEIVGLEVPHGIKVGLELRHLLERGRKVRPVFHLLVVVGPVPEQRHGHVLEAERGQPHRLARGIDLAEVRLREAELRPLPGQKSARARRIGRLAQDRERHEQDRDRHEGEERFPPQSEPRWCRRGHAATSRALRHTAPTTKKATR